MADAPIDPSQRDDTSHEPDGSGSNARACIAGPAHVTLLPGKKTAAGRIVALKGRTLFLVAETGLQLRNLLKVEAGNRLWIGEVWACEKQSDGFHVEMQVHSALGDLAAVGELATRFKHTLPEPEDVPAARNPSLSPRQ